MAQAVTATQGKPRAPVHLLRGLALCTVACISSLATAVAAENKPFAAPQAAEAAPTSAAGGLAQVTLSLLLVLAAVFAAAWVVRRLRNFGRPGAGAIEIVADIALGAKERAVLVQVGKQQLLLGVAPGRVSALHVLAEPVVAGQRAALEISNAGEQGTAQQGLLAAGTAHPDFKAILKRSLGL